MTETLSASQAPQAFAVACGKTVKAITARSREEAYAVMLSHLAGTAGVVVPVDHAPYLDLTPETGNPSQIRLTDALVRAGYVNAWMRPQSFAELPIDRPTVAAAVPYVDGPVVTVKRYNEKPRDKLLRLLKQAGPGGMQRQKLVSRTNSMYATDRNRLINSCIAEGLITLTRERRGTVCLSDWFTLTEYKQPASGE